MNPALVPARGFIAPEVRAEFPSLSLHWLTLAARRGPSPPQLIQRLRGLSDRFTGAGAVSMRTRPVPQAFRAFFRQVGLDPDVHRPPGEQAAVLRLLHGGFRTTDLITDSCLVALIETGVPVWALDADAVDENGPGIRTVTDSDRWPEEHRAPPGALVVADGRRVLGVLFGEPLEQVAVGRATTGVTLFSIGVHGVPSIHVEEALWVCADLLGGGTSGC